MRPFRPKADETGEKRCECRGVFCAGLGPGWCHGPALGTVGKLPSLGPPRGPIEKNVMPGVSDPATPNRQVLSMGAALWPFRPQPWVNFLMCFAITPIARSGSWTLRG